MKNGNEVIPEKEIINVANYGREVYINKLRKQISECMMIPPSIEGNIPIVDPYDSEIQQLASQSCFEYERWEHMIRLGVDIQKAVANFEHSIDSLAYAILSGTVVSIDKIFDDIQPIPPIEWEKLAATDKKPFAQFWNESNNYRKMHQKHKVRNGGKRKSILYDSTMGYGD